METTINRFTHLKCFGVFFQESFDRMSWYKSEVFEKENLFYYCIFIEVLFIGEGKVVQISAWKGFGEECWWGRDALQCRGYPRRWWRLCGCGRRLCVVVGVLGEGGEFVAGGNVVFVHGAVRVHHAAREVLRPQLAPVPVEGRHLSACTQRYDVSCSMRSLVNIPPFSTLLGPWNRLSILF